MVERPDPNKNYICFVWGFALVIKIRWSLLLLRYLHPKGRLIHFRHLREDPVDYARHFGFADNQMYLREQLQRSQLFGCLHQGL